MTPREILDLEISLLLLKHSRRSVLQAIARRERLSDDVVEQEFRSLLSVNNASNRKKKSSPKPFDIDSVISGREDKALLLRELNARFENRTFLPELKDVKRFFDRHGGHSTVLKSRILSQSSLFRLMADLEVVELKKLTLESPTQREFSSLGLISDEILRHSKNRKDNEEK
jgi:hypothetical protein